MKLQSSILLLSFVIIAASCSKSNYAQVEPDDLYFTHKDRKEALEPTIVPSSPMITSVEPVETPTEYNRNDYSDQHSPVLVTPSYGSPTIQQYGQQPQQPYYDTSVNPDYLYDEQYTEQENTSSAYYDETYAYQAPPAYETPQVNNYYYNLPNRSYYPTSAWMGGVYYSSFRPYRSSFSMIYDPFGSYYSPYYGYNSWNDPFYYGWNDPYYSRWNDPYRAWGNPYCGYTTTIYGGNYYGNNSYSNNNNSGTYYSDGTQVVTKPRQSRNQVSYEVDKTNLPIKTRREDYVTSTSEAGRVVNNSSGRTTVERNAGQSDYTRRGNTYTYQNGNTYTYQNGKTDRTSYQNGNRRPTSNTVQNRTATRNNGNRTVIVPTRTRTSTVNRSNTGQRNSNTRTYEANRSNVKRTSTPSRSSGGTRYSNSANSNRSNSYGTRSSNGRSSTGYSRSSSSGTRSNSYTPSRSSSRSSYKAPSRSSGSSSRSSSYTPSRSSTRSSGTRSSGSSSGRSSTSKKN